MTTTITYDPAGNELTSEDANSVTATNTYTPLNQLSGVSYSDSTHSVSYAYDANGKRTSMVDASGTSSYSYDPFDELTSTTNGASKTVSYTYDSLGDTTSVTYPLGGGATWANSDTVSYGYDSASLLTSVTDFNGTTSPVTNSADGLPLTLGLGSSGDTVTTAYAPTDAPSSITLGNGSTLQEFAYSDAPSGAVATETDTPTVTTEPAAYTYDAQSRVTQMTPGSTTAHNYAEDASGNLTTTPTGATGTYDDGSELTSTVLSGTTTNYTYNADGERTQAAIGGTANVTATYNGAAEVTSYDDSAANMTAATYNGDGVRTSNTVVGTTSSFVWDIKRSAPQLLMDSTNAYIAGPGSTPMEQVNLSSGTVTYLDSDALGSVRGVVASGGSLTAATAYTAFGAPETTGGLTSSTPLGFAGGYTDSTALLYLIDRYYDPTTGQFLSVDPLVDETHQAYAYTGSDPVNARDPMGLADYTPAELQEIEALGVISSAEASGSILPGDAIAAVTEVFADAIVQGDCSLAQTQMFTDEAAQATLAEVNVTSSGASQRVQAVALEIDAANAVSDAILAAMSAEAVGGNAQSFASEAASSAEQAVSDEGYQLGQIAAEGGGSLAGLADFAIAAFIDGAAGALTTALAVDAIGSVDEVGPIVATLALGGAFAPLAPALLASALLLFD
jgi:RHS repeat-associated protein